MKLPRKNYVLGAAIACLCGIAVQETKAQGFPPNPVVAYPYASGAEPSTNGFFLITPPSGGVLPPGSYLINLSGTATPNVDYTLSASNYFGGNFASITVNGNVANLTISGLLSGQYATVYVNTINDTIAEPQETVTFTPQNAFSTPGTINIADNDGILAYAHTHATEGVSSGFFLITPASGSTGGIAAGTYSINLSGTAIPTTDYTLSASNFFGAGIATVSIAGNVATLTVSALASGQYATVNINPVNDTISEPTETVTFTPTNPNSVAGTINILDNDSGLRAYAYSNAKEGVSSGLFLITPTGAGVSAGTYTINLSGTATPTSDYTLSASNFFGAGVANISVSGNVATLTISALTSGQYVSVNVNPVDNNVPEGTETVTLTPTTVGSIAGTINLEDNE